MADEPFRKPGESTIDPALSQALDDLERMLHDGDGDDGHEDGDEPSQDAYPPGLDFLDEPREPDTGEHINIPVLHPVLPGDPPAASAEAIADTLGRDPNLRAEVLERVVQRLTSEIDVIASDCVTRALVRLEKELHEEMRARVREHLRITLPELLDDLAR